jgi:TonB-dependent SusC/RagA subfamily outer membrane receptor
MKTKIISLLFLSLICSVSMSGQKAGKKMTVTGTVVDTYGMPIPNAIIMVDNKMSGSITDAGGKYKVRVKPGAELIAVSTFGSGIIEEYIKGRTRIDFKFSKSVPQRFGEEALSEEQKARMDAETYVNVGYNSVKKKDLIDHVSSVDLTKKKKTYTSIYDMIVEVSGVRIQGDQVIVLESRNMQGFVPALIVADGAYYEGLSDLNHLIPSSVESITVLKGASAAIYGTRAYGGVILIKTKPIKLEK